MLHCHQQEVSLTLSHCFCVSGLQINHRTVIFSVSSSKEPKEEGKKNKVKTLAMSHHFLSELENTIFLPLEKTLCEEKNLEI